MEELVFRKLKTKIIDGVNKKINANPELFNAPQEGGFKIVEGFMSLPIQDRIGKEYNIGAPFFPVIAIVGNSSGSIYYFPVREIIPKEVEKVEKAHTNGTSKKAK